MAIVNFKVVTAAAALALLTSMSVAQAGVIDKSNSSVTVDQVGKTGTFVEDITEFSLTKAQLEKGVVLDDSFTSTNGKLSNITQTLEEVSSTGAVIQTVFSGQGASLDEVLSSLAPIKANVGSYELVVTGDISGKSAKLDADYRVSTVPVPAALPMFGAGLIGLGAAARRRKAQKSV